MNKALDALKELGNYRIDDDMFIDFCIKDTNEYDIVENELKELLVTNKELIREVKALRAWREQDQKKLRIYEITLEKDVNIHALCNSNSLEQYNGTLNQDELYLELTQEEFDLLKGAY